MIHHTQRETVEGLARHMKEAIGGLFEPGHPPSDPYVAQLLRDIRGGRVKPLDMLAALFAAAVHDGRPAAKMEALANVIVSFINAHRKPAPPRPISLLVIRETQRDAVWDVAKTRLCLEPTPESKLEGLHALLAFRDVLDDVKVALEREVFRAPTHHADMRLLPPAA